MYQEIWVLYVDIYNELILEKYSVNDDKSLEPTGKLITISEKAGTKSKLEGHDKYILILEDVQNTTRYTVMQLD